MIRRNQIRVIALSSILMAGACFGCIAGAITYAGYATVADIVRTIGPGDKPLKSIFLNANIWETDGPTFFMYAKMGANGDETRIKVTKRISPTVAGNKLNLCVFEYDDAAYDRIKFERFNSRYYGETAKLTDETGYQIVGTFQSTSWKYNGSDAVALRQDEKDSNHYVANHVTLAANTQLKVRHGSNWYTNASNGNHYTLVGNGLGSKNVNISTASTYTVDFYLSATNENHIVLTDENDRNDYIWNYTGWMDNDSSTSTNYYCVNNWTNGASPQTNQLEDYQGNLRFVSI